MVGHEKQGEIMSELSEEARLLRALELSSVHERHVQPGHNDVVVVDLLPY